MDINFAWCKLRELLGNEHFELGPKIMQGDYPVQWWEVVIKGNVFTGETFEEVLEQIKVKYDHQHR